MVDHVTIDHLGVYPVREQAVYIMVIEETVVLLIPLNTGVSNYSQVKDM